MSLALASIHNVKICTVCGIEKNCSEFYINKATRDGLQAACIVCDKKRQQKRRNLSGVKEYAKDYRKRKFNDMNFRLQALINTSKQRAKNKNLEHTLTKKDLFDLYPVDGKCPIFGFDLEWNSQGFRETSPSIDRIDSSLGYTLDNVQIISWKANRIKNCATIDEIEAILNYMKSGG